MQKNLQELKQKMSDAFIKEFKKQTLIHWKCEFCGKITKSAKGRYFEIHNKEKWLECQCEGFMKPVYEDFIEKAGVNHNHFVEDDVAVKKKAKVVILDNNPLSVSCYMDEHPETFKKKKGVETKNGK